jgi:iron(III) transport system permease protein
MTLAIPRPRERVARRVDPSAAVLVVLGLFLCGLVLLPLAWLAWYSITDKDGALTIGNSFGWRAIRPSSRPI